MVFYPDNAQRATRLQQLVDSMANMQTDIKNGVTQMDAKNKEIRPAINELLKANHFDTIDELVAKAMALLTPDERKVFEAMIKQAQASKAGFDWTYFAAGLLMLPEGLILTGKLVLGIGRFVSKISIVQSIANCFTAADEAGAAGAAAAAAEAEKAATSAEEDLGGLAEGGEAATEAVEAVSVMSKVATFCKVLGAIGFVVTLVVGIVEIVEGAEQKEKLIDAIQNCQPARLCIKYFKVESDNILEQLENIGVYLQASTGPDADPDVAAYIAKSIITSISAADSAIDWTDLETQLETQDRTSANFYGDADLPKAQVVSIAKGQANAAPPITTVTAAVVPAHLKTAPAPAPAPVKAPAAPVAHPPIALHPIVHPPVLPHLPGHQVPLQPVHPVRPVHHVELPYVVHK